MVMYMYVIIWYLSEEIVLGRDVCAVKTAKTDLHQLCADTGCSLEYLYDKDEWQECQGILCYQCCDLMMTSIFLYI